MIRQSGHFEYDENLEGFYDYRGYGERRVQEEGGQFNECGYVAYHGTMTLDILMGSPRGLPRGERRKERSRAQSSPLGGDGVGGVSSDGMGVQCTSHHHG